MCFQHSFFAFFTFIVFPLIIHYVHVAPLNFIKPCLFPMTLIHFIHLFFFHKKQVSDHFHNFQPYSHFCIYIKLKKSELHFCVWCLIQLRHIQCVFKFTCTLHQKKSPIKKPIYIYIYIYVYTYIRHATLFFEIEKRETF